MNSTTAQHLNTFTADFWKSKPFRKNVFPQWKDWQKKKHWKNRVKHYLPRTDPGPNDVEFRDMIELWDPKKKKDANQYT